MVRNRCVEHIGKGIETSTMASAPKPRTPNSASDAESGRDALLGANVAGSQVSVLDYVTLGHGGSGSDRTIYVSRKPEGHLSRWPKPSVCVCVFVRERDPDTGCSIDVKLLEDDVGLIVCILHRCVTPSTFTACGSQVFIVVAHRFTPGATSSCLEPQPWCGERRNGCFSTPPVG